MTELKVLFVCTGNICRSPAAEGVMRHKLAEAGLDRRVAVDSAGTIGFHSGDPPDPRTIDRAARRGYDLTPLRARRIRRGDFEAFDMVVCMDRGHHEELSALCPPGRRAALRLFMEFVPAADGLLDVPDPYYGDDRDHDRALDLIEPGVDGLIEAIRRELP